MKSGILDYFTSQLRKTLTGIAGGTMLGVLAMTAPGMAAADTAPVRVGMIGYGAYGAVDPHFLGDEANYVANQHVVFESLMRQTNDGKFEYVLAESIEPLDETARIWQIRLKPGVKFHDGSDLDAEDVVFTLKRIADPAAVATGPIGEITDYEIVDDLTLNVTLAAPRSWFREGLAHVFASIVPTGFTPENPIGTGPFMVSKINESQSIELTRFDGYHGEPAKSEKVVVQFFEDPSAQLNALRAGQMDLIIGVSPSITGEIEGDDTLSLYESSTGLSYPIQMRTDVAPFSDPRLRKALQLVIDRDAVRFSAYNGYADVSNDLFSHYDADARNDLVRERNVDEARRLVQDAGLDGVELELVMLQDVGTALVLAENAKEIGVDIKVTTLDGATFYGEEYFSRPFFGGDYFPSDPFFVTSSLVYAPNPGFDSVRWRDEEYNAMWTEASETLDPARVSALKSEMQQILFDRGAWIIAVNPYELAIYNNDVKGLPEFDYTGTGMYRALPNLYISEK